jgi:hypothetical protein
LNRANRLQRRTQRVLLDGAPQVKQAGKLLMPDGTPRDLVADYGTNTSVQHIVRQLFTYLVLARCSVRWRCCMALQRMKHASTLGSG